MNRLTPEQVLAALPPGAVRTAREIAADYAAPRHHASLTLQAMRAGGIVEHAPSEPGSVYSIAGWRRVVGVPAPEAT